MHSNCKVKSCVCYVISSFSQRFQNYYGKCKKQKKKRKEKPLIQKCPEDGF